MKLKIYDATTVVASSRKSKHAVNMNYKTGLIALSKELVQTIKLKKGEKIAIAQDETSPKDWYIIKSKDGFEFREDKRGCLLLNNVTLTRAIGDSVGIDYSTTYLVGREFLKVDGVEALPIFTKSGIKAK